MHAFYRACARRRQPAGRVPCGWRARPGARRDLERRMASVAQGPLAVRYGGVVLDCDGLLYLRDQVIASAPPALRGIRSLGVRVAFVTNHSAVPPADVARRLGRLGVQADPAEVSTSAQAVVGLLGGRERLDGVRVLVLGGEGLREALARAGAALLGPQDDWRSARIVAVGLDTGLTYDRVRRAA